MLGETAIGVLHRSRLRALCGDPRMSLVNREQGVAAETTKTKLTGPGPISFHLEFDRRLRHSIRLVGAFRPTACHDPFTKLVSVHWFWHEDHVVVELIGK